MWSSVTTRICVTVTGSDHGNDSRRPRRGRSGRRSGRAASGQRWRVLTQRRRWPVARKPAIVTCRPRREGGIVFAAPRRTGWRSCAPRVAAGAEFIDIEMGRGPPAVSSPPAAAAASCSRITVLTPFRRMRPTRSRECGRPGRKSSKFAVPAERVADVRRLIDAAALTPASARGTVLIGMGAARVA